MKNFLNYSIIKNISYLLTFFICSIMVFFKPIISQAQQNTIIQAQLIDPQRQAIPYANIGIIGTNVGTVSTPDGSFSLYLKKEVNEEQVVRISHLRYEAKDFTIASLLLLNHGTIRLEESAISLATVEVRPTGTQIKKLGHTKTSTQRVTNFSISKQPNQNLGAAIGKKFNLGKYPVQLNNFQFYIANNNFDTVRFQIDIYSLKNGKPHKHINTQPIIIEINEQQKGWITIDLQPYTIYTKGKIAITATWIYHSKKGKRLQLPITIPVFGATHYYRYGSQSKWKQFRVMSTAMELEILY